MAAQDQLKLSSDSLLRTGEPAGVFAPPSAYDAPEIANGNIFPASDAWSLGMTVMEALTQRLPAVEGIDGTFAGDCAGAVHGNRPLLSAP